MKTDKKIAIGVGSLFSITMILGMINAYTVAPIFKTSLNNIASNEIQIIIGALCIFFMSIGVVGIAILLFPVLEKHNKLVAFTYLATRIIECLLLIVGVIVYLFLLTLIQKYFDMGNPDTSYFQPVVGLSIKIKYISYQLAMVVLGIGSLFFCVLLFQTKLIPRFLSIWGFIGYVFLLASALLDIFGFIDTIDGAGIIMYLPGGIWELIALPIWLIIKGFNSSSINKELV